jgi:hypothetical protein
VPLGLAIETLESRNPNELRGSTALFGVPRHQITISAR